MRISDWRSDVCSSDLDSNIWAVPSSLLSPSISCWSRAQFLRKTPQNQPRVRRFPMSHCHPSWIECSATMSAHGAQVTQRPSPRYLRRMGSFCKAIARRYVVVRPSRPLIRIKERVVKYAYLRLLLPPQKPPATSLVRIATTILQNQER